jgi:hypothetical protein
MTKADLRLVLIIFFLGLFCLLGQNLLFSPKEEIKQVVFKVEGKVVETVVLSAENEHRKIVLAGKLGPVVAEIEGFKIRILSAACPDQICVEQGWIEQAPQTIICVPNEIVVFFKSGSSLDGITG